MCQKFSTTLRSGLFDDRLNMELPLFSMNFCVFFEVCEDALSCCSSQSSSYSDFIVSNKFSLKMLIYLVAFKFHFTSTYRRSPVGSNIPHNVTLHPPYYGIGFSILFFGSCRDQTWQISTFHIDNEENPEIFKLEEPKIFGD